MMAFLELTFRSPSHFIGMCILILIIGSMTALVAEAIRGPKP